MPEKPKLGAFSLLSIGIGGMIGGGIFAVTGLAIEITKGGAPTAFLIAGIVALLTSYSYYRLTLRFPGEGGTVEFLNRAFGTGIFTGAANILLLLNYVVLVSIYAYAFGSYGATFFPPDEARVWLHVLICSVLVGLTLLNIFSASLVMRSENLFNVLKLLLLAGFVIGGLLTPMNWSQLELSNYVSPLALIAGAMLIFLNYEGFELIANASKDVARPERSLAIAYFGGVLIVIAIYILIVMVVVGHVSPSEIEKFSDRALSVAGQDIMGRAGFIGIAVAALLATSSAINATLYGTGRLTYIVAKSGQLPSELERPMRGEHIEGAIITSVLALLVANFMPLEAIATMGSAGFLLIFLGVNISNFRLRKQTGGHAWISLLAAMATGLALIVLCVKVDENPATRNHLWILLGMIATSFLIEIVYRRYTGRAIQSRKETADH